MLALALIPWGGSGATCATAKTASLYLIRIVEQ